MIIPTVQDVLLAICEADTPEQAMEAIWRMVEPEWDNLPKVRPGDYKLPEKITTAMWKGGIARWGKDEYGYDSWRWQGLMLNIGPGTEGH